MWQYWRLHTGAVYAVETDDMENPIQDGNIYKVAGPLETDPEITQTFLDEGWDAEAESHLVEMMENERENNGVSWVRPR